MKISIFGASGFIGNHLVTALQSAHSVTQISLRQDDWKSKFSSSDIFINLLGKTPSRNTSKDEIYHVNITLVQEIFRLFINSDAKLFIHISSLAALEELESEKPLTEVDPCRPDSWYGKSKREAEVWLMNQNLPIDKKVIILRPPMVHGVGDKSNLRLLYRFISNGIPYPLSAFENKRSFISIDNFIYFITEILKNSDKLSGGIYHIADDDPVSTIDIIRIIKNVTDKHTIDLRLPKFILTSVAKIGDLIPLPLNSHRLKKITSDLILSNQKIKSALGIEDLPIMAKDGITKTIKSYRNLT